MGEILKILALHEQGLSINEISKRKGHSKSTIHKRLSQLAEANIDVAKAKEMKPEDLKEAILPPKRMRMDYFEPNWDNVLRKTKNRRRGVTLKNLWEEYCTDSARAPEQKLLTYPAFCRIFKRYEKTLPPEKASLFRMHMDWIAGEVVIVDYAGDTMFLQDPKTGKKEKVYLFVSVLAYSGLIFCKPTLHQRRDDWLDCLTEMFTFYNGVTEVIYLDNSTSLVRKADKYDPKVCDEFATFCEHYGTVPNPVAPGEPRHKGLVENAVKQCTAKIIRVLRDQTFFSLSELDAEVKKLLHGINSAQMDAYLQESRLERYEDEKVYLKKLPPVPYEPSLIVLNRKVQAGYVIRYEDCRYSVPYTYIGKTVRVLVRPRKKLLEIVDTESDEIIASHPLSEKKGKFFIRREHMPAVHQYVAMTDAERLEEISLAGEKAHEFALYLIQHEAKATVYRHLQGLQNARKRLGNEKFEQCCTKALGHYVISYEAFTSEEDQLLKEAKGTEKVLKKGARMVLPIENENVRGEDYYKENPTETKEDEEENKDA